MDRPPRGDSPKKKSGRRQAEPDLFETAIPAAHSTASAQFSGTDNPRHLRVIHALMLRARRREEIDGIAGASNGPELVAELRRRGLRAKCSRTPGIDQDGRPVKFGVYSLDDGDRRAINAWLRARDLKAGK
jgi:hypothetical protein